MPPVSVYSVMVRLGLVLVLVCAYCSACADLCNSGPESLQDHKYMASALHGVLLYTTPSHRETSG